MTTKIAEAREPSRLHRVSGRAGLGVGLTLTTVALWSVLPLGLKIVLAGLDAPTLTWYRFVGAALVLGAVLAAQGRLPRPASFDRRDWALLAVAIVFLCANYLLYVLGLERTNLHKRMKALQLSRRN